MKKSLIFSFICLMSLYLSGCSLISPKDDDSLKGERCHLTKVHFFRKGSTQNFIFKLMKDMQIQKIMALLEHKYGISVDYSEFDLFLYNKDPLKIRAEGILSYNDFYWESGGEYPNRIEIDILLTETATATAFDRDYSITIRIGNSVKTRVNGSFVADVPTIDGVAARLNYSKKPACDDIYINKNTKEEVDLFAEMAKKSSPEAVAERKYLLKCDEVKEKIKESYDGISPAERERYIKDMRDYLDEIGK